jgi:hypothetical protein
MQFHFLFVAAGDHARRSILALQQGHGRLWRQLASGSG